MMTHRSVVDKQRDVLFAFAMFSFVGSRLEDLPNELFFVIFSYLKTEMIIQTFIDLNERFQFLIRQSMHHLVLSSETKSDSIERYLKSIEHEIETLTSSVELIPVLFSGKYSYSNLRLLTIYFDINWRIELNVETICPIVAVVQTLNTLNQCSFAMVNEYLEKILRNNHQRKLSNEIDVHPSYFAVRRLWICECNERDLWKICAYVPGLTYLRFWLRSSSTSEHFSLVPTTNIPFLTHLDELYAKVVDLRSLNDAKQMIHRCQRTLRRISLDFGEDLIINGSVLEALLMPLTVLQTISFISRFEMKSINFANLFSSFQSQWWLDAQRPPVLIHQGNTNQFLVLSIPSSCPRILKDFHFSTDLRSWHFNKGTTDSFTNGEIQVNHIYFFTKQSITPEFLKFTAGIFHSPRQTFDCRYWGLTFEQEYFQNFIELSREIHLPNITQMNIAFLNGLTPLTFVIWLHLAPNIRTLGIQFLTYEEIIEWFTDLQDSSLLIDQRMKMIFERISRIIIPTLCYTNVRLRENLSHLFSQIFSNAIIN